MKKILFLFFGILFIVSCGGYKEGIVQKSDESFLKFTGNWQNVTVQIDDLPPFIFEKQDKSEKRKSKKEILYQISPGKHIIKVYRGGRLLVNRILFLDNHVIKEVRIP